MRKLCYGCMREKTEAPVCARCGYDERTQNGPDNLPAGTVLHGRYLIGRMLDVDQYTVFYLGLDILQKSTVVVKEYFPRLLSAREKHSMYLINLEKGGNPYYEYFRQRFIEEMGIRVMDACLPGIARVYGVFEENNTAYIITEYVEGMSLRNYVKKLGRPMTGIEVDRAMYMAVNALSAMHRRGQLHWEINPDNVMIQPDGTAKLINFADATLRLDPKTHEIGAAMGPVVLCNGFSPMEVYQMRGTRGPWTDIYGMCATLYWCMTGMKPPAAFERILEDSLDWSALKDLTPISLDAMKKGLALRGSERFQSVDEFWMRFTSAYVTIPREPEKMQPNFPEHDTEKPADRSWLKKWFVK